MDNRDIETELKKAADEAKNIGTKSADDRMCAIEHRLESRPERSGGAERNRVPVASQKAGAISRGRAAASVFAAVAAALLCVLTIFVVLDMRRDPVSHLTYHENSLVAKIVSEEEFYDGVLPILPDLADFDNGLIHNYALLLSDGDLVVRGGMVEMYDGEDIATVSAVVYFFDAEYVIVDRTYAESFDLTYDAGGTEISYKLTEHISEGGIEAFAYDAIAEYSGSIYKMEYFALADDVTDFFDSLFA